MDNDRIGSLILYNKNHIKINKEIKKINQSTKIIYHEKFNIKTRKKN